MACIKLTGNQSLLVLPWEDSLWFGGCCSWGGDRHWWPLLAARECTEKPGEITLQCLLLTQFKIMPRGKEESFQYHK